MTRPVPPVPLLEERHARRLAALFTLAALLVPLGVYLLGRLA